ncbi:MAG: prepilin-type cleavage/methylation domain-containing protein [Proteobacteria bacterium]|nr:prepilin-type cleavage/methylation domain-containing protein [Pseudomonadota bacterium]
MKPRTVAFRSFGFSLMELAVVLVIVALLLGGLLVPLGTQRDVEFMRATEKSLADIREALIGFAAVNGRLPCPAQATIASGAANAGIEATMVSSGITYCACAAAASTGVAAIGTTACVAPAAQASGDTVGGVLPWATLGLLETDAWGNRYTYRVSNLFARGINSAETLFGTGCTPSTSPVIHAAFALCSPTNPATPTAPAAVSGIKVLTATVANGGVTLADWLPAIVISHGGNGLGAYTTLGTQLTAAAAGTEEAENSDGDATFVSNTTIDDRLIWIPTSQLMNRMITAGKLP